MCTRLLGMLLPGLCLAAYAAETKDLAPEEIIKKFAAKEAEFAKARENYTYRQSLKIQELSPSGAVQGQPMAGRSIQRSQRLR